MSAERLPLPIRIAIESFESLLGAVAVWAFHGYVGSSGAPLWLLMLVMVGVGAFQNERTQHRLGGADLSRNIGARVSAHVALCTAAVYLTGSAPVLNGCLLIPLAYHLRWSGSRACRPAMISTLACTLVGELTIASGWITPEWVTVSQPKFHLLTAIQTAVILFMTGLLGRAKKAEEAAVAQMRSSEERHRALVQNAMDVVAVSTEEGLLTYVSPSVRKVMGYEPDRVINTPGRRLIHHDDQRLAADALAQILENPGKEVRIEVRGAHGDGGWRWNEVTLHNLLADPAVRGIVSTYRDVSDRKELENRLRRLAYHDPLTGLANRRTFTERLNQLIGDHASAGAHAVMVIDLDDFKTINDSLGHDVGDRLLIDVSRRLQATLREGDLLARLGGDEFAILLTGIERGATLCTIAERIVSAAARGFDYDGSTFPISASVGVAAGCPEIGTAEELTRRADVAMYVSKTQGKSRATIFEPGMQLAVQDRLLLRAELSQALQAGQLDVHYQPIVDLITGTVLGIEALLRWTHPDLGSIPPVEFIPVAEDTGLIGELGGWVLHRACTQVSRWRAIHPELMVSVNVASRQLRDPRFPGEVRQALQDAQLPPGALMLELTESSLLDDALPTVQELHDMGVRLAIDDFGTGYSSLSYLQRLPIDVLKIDRSFVQGIGAPGRATAIMDAIVRVGHALGIELVAEGVERNEQAAMLAAHGCTQAQGYLFAAPLDPSGAERFLRAHPAGPPPHEVVAAVPSPRMPADKRQPSSVRPQ